ncbi:2122_t:CDS:2, partial [Ambispora gerdemannii]
IVREGTSRFEVDPNDDITVVAEKIAIQLKFDPSTLKYQKTRKMVYKRNIFPDKVSLITFEDGVKPDTSAVSAGKQSASTVGPFEPTANTSSSSALNLKQEVVEDYLEKQSGFIKRGCAPKFRKSDQTRKVPKEYVKSTGTNAKFIQGICTKCQPSALTLQQVREQSTLTAFLLLIRLIGFIITFVAIRMVDHRISLMTSLISGDLLDRYLYGRYEPYLDVLLEESVDEGLLLVDYSKSRKSNLQATHFLSSQECCFSAAMQTKNPNVTKLSASGKFSSKFVTCVITGNENGEVLVLVRRW